jgi:hypothetical protein
MSLETAKLFTVKEVNRAIPFLERRLARVHARMRKLAAAAPQPEAALPHTGHEGGDAVPPDYLRGIQELQAEAQALQDQGILVRDLRRGLLDFPSVLDGRKVYLCWVRGEERVGFFHDLEAGFAGRKPLPGADLE